MTTKWDDAVKDALKDIQYGKGVYLVCVGEIKGEELDVTSSGCGNIADIVALLSLQMGEVMLQLQHGPDDPTIDKQRARILARKLREVVKLIESDPRPRPKGH